MQTTPEQFGAGVAHTLGQLADAMIAKQKPLDAAKASSEYDIQVDDAINALAGNQDPNTWREQILQKEKEIRKSLTATYTDPEVQKALMLHADRRFGDNIRRVTGLQIEASHGKQLGDIETLRNMLARRIAETDDPVEIESSRRIFHAAVNTASVPTIIAGRPVPATLNPKQAEHERQLFEKKALDEYGDKVLRGNPEAILTNDAVRNRLSPLGDAGLLEMESKARKEIELREAHAERITNRNKKLVIDAAEAQANFGRLNPAWLDNALAGNDPLVRPSEARHLKEVNEGTEGGRLAAADAIWDEYTASGRSIPSIDRTLAKLNQLSKELGAPNKWVLKYKDTLQSDRTTLENQGISREANAIARDNREIHNLKTEYDAWVQSNPIITQIMGNMAVHEKAQIESVFRNQGRDAALKKLESFKKGITEKSNTVDPATKKVKDF